MRWRLRLSKYTFDMQYKPSASHHTSKVSSRTDNDAAVDHINDDVPCLAMAETADGLFMGRNTGTEMLAPVENDAIVEGQEPDEYCFELANRVARKAAKAFFGK